MVHPSFDRAFAKGSLAPVSVVPAGYWMDMTYGFKIGTQRLNRNNRARSHLGPRLSSESITFRRDHFAKRATHRRLPPHLRC